MSIQQETLSTVKVTITSIQEGHLKNVLPIQIQSDKAVAFKDYRLGMTSLELQVPDVLIAYRAVLNLIGWSYTPEMEDWRSRIKLYIFQYKFFRHCDEGLLSFEVPPQQYYEFSAFYAREKELLNEVFSDSVLSKLFNLFDGNIKEVSAAPVDPIVSTAPVISAAPVDPIVSAAPVDSIVSAAPVVSQVSLLRNTKKSRKNRSSKIGLSISTVIPTEIYCFDGKEVRKITFSTPVGEAVRTIDYTSLHVEKIKIPSQEGSENFFSAKSKNAYEFNPATSNLTIWKLEGGKFIEKDKYLIPYMEGEEKFLSKISPDEKSFVFVSINEKSGFYNLVLFSSNSMYCQYFMTVSRKAILNCDFCDLDIDNRMYSLRELTDEVPRQRDFCAEAHDSTPSKPKRVFLDVNVPGIYHASFKLPSRATDVYCLGNNKVVVCQGELPFPLLIVYDLSGEKPEEISTQLCDSTAYTCSVSGDYFVAKIAAEKGNDYFYIYDSRANTWTLSKPRTDKKLLVSRFSCQKLATSTGEIPVVVVSTGTNCPQLIVFSLPKMEILYQIKCKTILNKPGAKVNLHEQEFFLG